MQITVDDTKATTFVRLERKVQGLKDEKDQLEKAAQKAMEAYHGARQAAIQQMAPWEPVGAAHVAQMKLSTEFEKATTAHTAANNELSNAKAVMIEEFLRAARVAVPA